jgi:hypothetical protein
LSDELRVERKRRAFYIQGKKGRRKTGNKDWHQEFYKESFFCHFILLNFYFSRCSAVSPRLKLRKEDEQEREMFGNDIEASAL